MDDEEMMTVCEACEARVPFEQSVATEDGCDLCPSCWAEAQEAFRACAHEWKPATDQWGEDARTCDRCSFIVAVSDFPAVLGCDAPTPAQEPRA